MLVSKIIDSSLKLLGVLPVGETASGNEAEDALMVLNLLVDRLNAEYDLNIPNIVVQFQLPEGIDSPIFYLMSYDRYVELGLTEPPTATAIVQTLPVHISSFMLCENSNYDSLIKLEKMDVQQFIRLLDSDTSTNQPKYWYSQFEKNLQTYYFDCVPNRRYYVQLFARGEITAYQLNDDLVLPHGYERMLIYNLAVDLSPMYGTNPSPIVLQHANSSLVSVMRKGIDLKRLKTESIS